MWLLLTRVRSHLGEGWCSCIWWGETGDAALYLTVLGTAPTTEMEPAPEACHMEAKKACPSRRFVFLHLFFPLEKLASVTWDWVLESLIFSLLGVQDLHFFQ